MGWAAQLIPLWAFYAVPWAIALLVAALTAPRRGIVRALGLGLMTVPLWDTLLGIIDSFGPLLQGGVTLLPFSTYQLSGLYSYKLLGDLGYLAVGFLLFAGGPRFWDETPQTLARKLAALGFPMGQRSEGRSAFIGLLGFPLLLLGTQLVVQGTASLQSLRQSDESSVWANMTVYHAIVVSLAAAFSEELLFRGLLQTGAARLLAPRADPVQGTPGWAVGIAIAVQAIVFGFAHSGYATWIHVLLPTLFGLVSGIVAWRFGIWAGIVLHVVVDVFAFLAEMTQRVPVVSTVLVSLFTANLVLSVGWSIAWLVRRFGSKGNPV